MAPMLMHGLVGELPSPRRATPRQVRLSQLTPAALRKSLVITPDDVPHYAKGTLRKAAVASSEELAQWAPDVSAAQRAAATAKALLPSPTPLPRTHVGGDSRTMKQRLPRPRQHTFDAPPPVPRLEPPTSAPPYWKALPQSATGRQWQRHDGLHAWDTSQNVLVPRLKRSL
jgi:hypothetical protein